ncbi:hypothetical protein ACOME3_008612 [Neoechinorhynchus agilis]
MQKFWSNKYLACNYNLHLQQHRRVMKNLSSSTKSFWRVLKNSKFIKWKDKSLRWIRSSSYKVILYDILGKLSVGATNVSPTNDWLTLPLLRSLNEGDLHMDDILKARGSMIKLSSNNVCASSKCLRASREDWLSINLARGILIVKAKKKVVNSSSDLRPISIQNALVSLYEKALAIRLMEFCTEKDVINRNCHAMQLMADFYKEGVNIFIYADDISAVLFTNNSWELPILLKELLAHINKHAVLMGIGLNPNKTNIMAVVGSGYVNKELNLIIKN